MTLTKIITSIAVAGGIGAVTTPLIYQNQIDKFINQQKQQLKAQNIKLTEKSKNDTFTTTKREYILTISDVTPIVKILYPNITSWDLKDLKKAFDNTKFLVKINILKYPVYHKNAVEVSLYGFNKTITKELQNDKVGKQILNYIKNKAFLLSADIDNFNIAKAKLKDLNINLTEKNSYKTTNLKINTKNIFVKNGDKLKFNIDDIKINYTKIYNDNNHKYNDIYELKHLTYAIKKQNDLNYQTKSSIQDISIENLSPYKSDNLKVSINNIKSSSNVHTILKTLNISSKFSVANFQINANNESIKVNKLVFNNSISKLDETSIQNILKAAKNNDNLAIQNHTIKLIDNGAQIKINPLSVQNVDINMNNQKLSIAPISLNFDATLNKNNFNIDSKPQVLLNNINAKLHLETTKKNIDLLSKINPNILVMLATVMQMKKNKAIIDLEYKNSHIYSKGMELF